MHVRRALVSMVVVTLVAGCRLFRPVNPQGHTEPQAAPPADSAAAPAAAAVSPTAEPSSTPPVSTERPIDPGSFNDASIAAMLLASNNTDISYARLVPSRAERADVKEFAQRMLTDHVGVNGLVNALLAKLDLTPEDNVASLDLRDESSAKRDMMRELSGYAFDSTYIENEVSYHRRFLWAIDNVLEPRARNGDLKTLLSNVRPAIAAHLAHAEQVRANVLTKKK